MIAAIRTIKVLVYALTAALSSHIYAVGLYDASYENNLLKIPIIKVGDVVYEVAMIREESAELARIGCTEFCFRLASAEVARSYASSIYSFYDSATSTATIDNLWFENRVYKVTLKHTGHLNGSDYFIVVNADQKQGLPVYLTSYENKQFGYPDSSNLPSLDEVMNYSPEIGEQLSGPRNIAWGDFLGDGTQVALTAAPFFLNVYPEDNPAQLTDSNSKLYFLVKTEENKWIDVTERVLNNLDDRFACIAQGFFNVADYNNDGRPDVFLACGTIDFPINGSWFDESGEPIDAAKQKILISNGNGRYDLREILDGEKISAHQSTSLDIDGDGNIDIIIVDPKVNKVVIVLWGDGKGQFKKDTSLFPTTENIPVWFVSSVPINGRNVIILSSGFGIRFFEFVGNNFVETFKTEGFIFDIGSRKLLFESIYDVYFDESGRNFYFLMMGGVYEAFSIVRFNLQHNRYESLYLGGSPSVEVQFNLMRLRSDGFLSPITSNCSSIKERNSYFQNACELLVKVQ